MIENRVSILNEGTIINWLSFFKSMMGRNEPSGFGTRKRRL